MSTDTAGTGIPGIALGWDPEAESRFREELQSLKQSPCAASIHEIPRIVDLLSVLDRPSQGEINQCPGFGLANAQRACIYQDTGRVVELSGSFAYVAAKEVEGTPRNKDGGASIAAAALASIRFGAAMVEEFPNWQIKSDFYGRWPTGYVFQRAGNRRNLSICDLPSARSFAAFCGTGQGFGIAGTWWVEDLVRYQGGDLLPIKVIPGGRNYGGHCVSFLGYRFDVDDLYIDLANSHPNWGWRGANRAWVHESIIDHWIQTGPFGPIQGVSQSTGFTKTRLRLAGEIG